MGEYKSVTRDGMRVDWDVPITMDDGLELRCDVYRPVQEGRYPAILAMGPYGKWLHFAEFPGQYNRLVQEHPEVLSDTSGNHLNYETVDPEKFVPEGYVVVRIDSRGAGRSPGFLDIWSLREAQDYYTCIEWAARQPWCTGKVASSGISYLAMNQWQVAALQPPHLTCMFVFEGAYDYYRDMARHGGILCTFSKVLYGPAILSVQHGRGRRGQRSRMNGDWVSGPATLSDEELGNNRREWHEDCVNYGLASDEFWTSRLPDLSKIKVPFLSLANWGGQGLHLRGNVEAFLGAASEQKWLEFHGLEHWTEYYTDYGVALQKRFLAHFLKGEDNGWAEEPRVQMVVRRPGRAVHPPRRERMAARTHPMEEALSASGRPQPRQRACDRAGAGDVSWLVGGRDIPYSAVGRGYRDHRSDRRQAVRLVGDQRCRSVRRGARIRARLPGDHVPGPHRPSHHTRARLAAELLIASSTPRAVCPTGPFTAMTRSRSWRPGRSTSSRSRYCRPAWSFRRRTASL